MEMAPAFQMALPVSLGKSHKVSCAPAHFLELVFFTSLKDLGCFEFAKNFKASTQIMGRNNPCPPAVCFGLDRNMCSFDKRT